MNDEIERREFWGAVAAVIVFGAFFAFMGEAAAGFRGWPFLLAYLLGAWFSWVTCKNCYKVDEQRKLLDVLRQELERCRHEPEGSWPAGGGEGENAAAPADARLATLTPGYAAGARLGVEQLRRVLAAAAGELTAPNPRTISPQLPSAEGSLRHPAGQAAPSSGESCRNAEPDHLRRVEITVTAP